MSVLGGMMFLQAGLAGSFLLRLVRAMVVNSHAGIVKKKKRFREVRSLVSKFCSQLLPVYALSQDLLTEETEKSVWKGLC